MTPESPPSVHYGFAEGVATLALDAPQRKNSITPELLERLGEAFAAASADSRVEGIVIAAQGPTFSIGMDLDFFLSAIDVGDLDRIVSVSRQAHQLFNAIAGSRKPVVARVHAANFGAGVELSLACHRIVAARGSSFCLPETGLGIYPGLGGTQRSRHKLGPGLAKWMIFTGKTVSAIDAAKIGLVDLLVEGDDLAGAAASVALGQIPCPRRRVPVEYSRLAEFFDTHSADELRTGAADAGGDRTLERAMKSVASKAPVPLRFVEQLIDRGKQCPLAESLEMELEHTLDVFRTADACNALRYRARTQVGMIPFEGR